MKKNLLVLASLFSAMAMSVFCVAGCNNSGHAEVSSNIKEYSSNNKVSSEDRYSSEDVYSSEESSEEESSEEEIQYYITLNESSLSMEIYTSATLTVESTNSEEAIVWESSDEFVVSVADGVITAYKAGTATITVTAGQATATCEVTVVAGAESPVFAVLENEITLSVGEESTFDVALTYQGEAFNFVSNIFVLTKGDAVVVSDNVITAMAAGKQEIYITAMVGDQAVASKTITITVV